MAVRSCAAAGEGGGFTAVQNTPHSTAGHRGSRQLRTFWILRLPVVGLRCVWACRSTQSLGRLNSGPPMPTLWSFQIKASPTVDVTTAGKAGS